MAGDIFRRIETMGSYWDIDEDLKRYRRWPKHEGPREIPEWGNAQAGPLQDFIWHPYHSYAVGPFTLTFRDAGGDLLLCAPFELSVEEALEGLKKLPGQGSNLRPTP